VQRFKSENLENQQIQGALDEVRRFAHVSFLSVTER
jgi:hypothetical protein